MVYLLFYAMLLTILTQVFCEVFFPSQVFNLTKLQLDNLFEDLCGSKQGFVICWV